jgi:hypothetical protein
MINCLALGNIQLSSTSSQFSNCQFWTDLEHSYDILGARMLWKPEITKQSHFIIWGLWSCSTGVIMIQWPQHPYKPMHVHNILWYHPYSLKSGIQILNPAKINYIPSLPSGCMLCAVSLWLLWIYQVQVWYQMRSYSILSFCINSCNFGHLIPTKSFLEDQTPLLGLQNRGRKRGYMYIIRAVGTRPGLWLAQWELIDVYVIKLKIGQDMKILYNPNILCCRTHILKCTVDGTLYLTKKSWNYKSLEECNGFRPHPHDGTTIMVDMISWFATLWWPLAEY